MKDDIVISCQDLGKKFVDGPIHVDVFSSVNISVKSGEMIAVTGASGSGKSTLLHLLGGLDKPSSGSVCLMGSDISQLNERQKSTFRNQYLGFVYQFHHLLPEFSALENVCMPLLIRNEPFNKAKEQAMDLIDHVGLSNRAQHRVGELSGGERQRIAIARALVTCPKCVLADEPTGNLDSATALNVFELMLDLNQKFNTSFVVVTHTESLAEKLDRIITLNDGEIS
jgi:lipoprotein-releasing system ATP-binding protein